QNEIGAAHARKLLLEAEIIDAAEALSIGLVHKVTRPEDLAQTVQSRAETYASGPRVAYALIKQNLQDASTATLDETLQFEAERLVQAKQTNDHKEAIRAFATKQRPVFRGW
ncbi:MAG: enoyl-CoA hydratase-related protein, partial [Paracoccaceae bacterium]